MMTQHIENTLPMTAEEMKAYFRAQQFDLDQIAAYSDACEEEARKAEYRAEHFGTAYDEGLGYWTYGSAEADAEHSELCDLVKRYREMAEIAELYYIQLDNELAAA